MKDLITEQQAEEYLNSLSQTSTAQDLSIPNELFTIQQNEKIIKLADSNLIERLEHMDWSLKVSDIVSAKDAAFRHNLKLLWLDEDKDKQLIPANITINIVNN